MGHSRNEEMGGCKKKRGGKRRKEKEILMLNKLDRK